jgi:hypothetical protein
MPALNVQTALKMTAEETVTYLRMRGIAGQDPRKVVYGIPNPV